MVVKGVEAPSLPFISAPEGAPARVRMVEREGQPPPAVSEGRCFLKQLFGLLLLLIFAGSMHAGDVCKKYQEI